MPEGKISKPIGSMYGIFTYIYHTNQTNVGKYTCTIHGWYGLSKFYMFIEANCQNQFHVVPLQKQKAFLKKTYAYTSYTMHYMFTYDCILHENMTKKDRHIEVGSGISVYP